MLPIPFLHLRLWHPDQLMCSRITPDIDNRLTKLVPAYPGEDLYPEVIVDSASGDTIDVTCY